MTDANPVNEDFRSRYGSPMERAFYEGVEKDREIDRLKALVARLTDRPTHAETFAMLAAIKGQRSPAAIYGALTAFLERRMKG